MEANLLCAGFEQNEHDLKSHYENHPRVKIIDYQTTPIVLDLVGKDVTTPYFDERMIVVPDVACGMKEFRRWLDNLHEEPSAVETHLDYIVMPELIEQRRVGYLNAQAKATRLNFSNGESREGEYNINHRTPIFSTLTVNYFPNEGLGVAYQEGTIEKNDFNGFDRSALARFDARLKPRRGLARIIQQFQEDRIKD